MVEIPADGSLQLLQQCVKVVIEGLGEDCAREGLVDTPLRVAKAYKDLTRGVRHSIDSAIAKAKFKEPIVHKGSGGLVIVKDIEFAGLSEHNLLPFFGVCHVGYVPSDGVVLGLSKFARLAKWQAKRVQSQQSFTDDICATLQAELMPQALAVFVQASHLHLSSHPTVSTTCQVAGSFAAHSPDATSKAALQELCILLQLDAAVLLHGKQPHSVAARSSEAAQQLLSDRRRPAAERMQRAVENILCCCDHDPSRPGLQGAPERYVASLLAATSGYARQQAGYHHQPPPSSGASSPTADEHRPPTPSPQSPPTATPASPSPPDSPGSTPSYLHPNGHAALRHTPSAPLVWEPLPQPPAPILPSPHRAPHTPPPPTTHLPTCNGICHCPFPTSPCPQTHTLGNATITLLPPPSPIPSSPDACHTHALVSFVSLCEHHLLPFHGHLYLALTTDSQTTPDPSQLLHAVACHTQRLQLQERITHQVANAVGAMPGVRGVLVVCSAMHMCMVARGVESHASRTVTVAGRGGFSEGEPGRLAVVAHATRVLEEAGRGSRGGCC